MPLLFLTSLIPVGNKVVGVPLFYAAVVAGSFFYGYLRIVFPAVCRQLVRTRCITSSGA